ncbi:Protein CBG21376 [Caenorhabditis briggsae]|uniref:Protein CBG21376 n=1 Tax=Caenorhabditis briggsae TaxID=6238 RepID=A8XZY5_CAEBR|nr:Protein CBG21376 [Caenorhabditis briggsae]CAP38202.1 Protein CBG21376 [Caenorhabditis briggsae]
MDMDNNFRREQAQIRGLQRELDWEKDMSREMVYRKGETDSDIERHPERHAKTLEKVRREHEEKVNASIIYAAELTRRVECLDRIEEKQKSQLEILKKAENAVIEMVNASIVYAAELTRRVEIMKKVEGKQKEQLEKIQEVVDVVFVTLLQRKLRLATGLLKRFGNVKTVESAVEEWEKKHEGNMNEVRRKRNEKVDSAILYAAEMEKRVESLERNDKKQKEQFEKFEEVLKVLEDENVKYEEKIKMMQKSLRAAKLQKKSAMSSSCKLHNPNQSKMVRQENGIQARTAILNGLKNALNQDENQPPAENQELKVALEYAAEMEKRVEGLDAVIRNQERMFQELAESMEKVRKANVALRRKNARLEAELKAAVSNQEDKENL